MAFAEPQNELFAHDYESQKKAFCYYCDIRESRYPYTEVLGRTEFITAILNYQTKTLKQNKTLKVCAIINTLLLLTQIATWINIL